MPRPSTHRGCKRAKFGTGRRAAWASAHRWDDIARHSVATSTGSCSAALKSEVLMFPQPALQLIYDTAPVGLACLSPDCRYLKINQRLTEICGISVEDHLGRSVRECVPALADSVEAIVRSIMETGEPVIGIEVAGQRADQVEGRYWVTYWHPLRTPSGEIVAVNVAAEEITERKRAEGRLRVQYTVAQILAEAATIEEVTPRILRAIGECLEWDAGALWRVDWEAEPLRCVELWHK